jgi:hypothetical protein
MYINQLITLSAFRDRGVPGPTSEDVAACPSPDGSARDGARRGEKQAAGARGRGGNPAAFVFCPAPRSGALAVGGYKRPRGRGSKRPHASACLVLFPARPTFCKRALVLPFIGVRRGSRCTKGGVAEC